MQAKLQSEVGTPASRMNVESTSHENISVSIFLLFKDCIVLFPQQSRQCAVESEGAAVIRLSVPGDSADEGPPAELWRR